MEHLRPSLEKKNVQRKILKEYPTVIVHKTTQRDEEEKI
jgi:hypothetical protein